MTAHDAALKQDPAVRRGYETSHVNTRGVLIFGVVLAIVVAIVGVVTWVNLSVRAVHPAPPQVAGPPLQDDEVADLTELREAQEQALNSYGWIDKEAGTVHIPIERAMRLYVERHAAKQENAEQQQNAENDQGQSAQEQQEEQQQDETR